MLANDEINTSRTDYENYVFSILGFFDHKNSHVSIIRQNHSWTTLGKASVRTIGPQCININDNLKLFSIELNFRWGKVSHRLKTISDGKGIHRQISPISSHSSRHSKDIPNGNRHWLGMGWQSSNYFKVVFDSPRRASGLSKGNSMRHLKNLLNRILQFISSNAVYFDDSQIYSKSL